MLETVINPSGKGCLNKENILAFLQSFRKRPGMYVSMPEDYGIVTSFLRGYMYCCYLQGYPCTTDFSEFPKSDERNAITSFIDCLILHVKAIRHQF